MTAVMDDQTQSIVVGTGNDRVAVNLRQTPAVSSMSMGMMIIADHLGSIPITSSDVGID